MNKIIGYTDQDKMLSMLSAYGIVASTFQKQIIYDDSKIVAFIEGVDTPIVADFDGDVLDAATLSSALKSDLTCITDLKLPNNITEIDPNTFDGMDNLSALSFPHTTMVGTIQSKTFKDCSQLKVLRLGFGTTTIEDQAFENASRLQTLDLPLSIKELPPSFLSAAPSDLVEFNLTLPYSEYMSCDADVFEYERSISTYNIAVFEEFLSKHLEGFSLEHKADGTEVMKFQIGSSSQEQTQLLGSEHSVDVKLPRVSYWAGGCLTTMQSFKERRVSATITGKGTIETHFPGINDPYHPIKCETHRTSYNATVFASQTYQISEIDIVSDIQPPSDNPQLCLAYNQAKNNIESKQKKLEASNIAAEKEAMDKLKTDLQRKLEEKKKKPSYRYGFPCGVCGAE